MNVLRDDWKYVNYVSGVGAGVAGSAKPTPKSSDLLKIPENSSTDVSTLQMRPNDEIHLIYGFFSPKNGIPCGKLKTNFCVGGHSNNNFALCRRAFSGLET